MVTAMRPMSPFRWLQTKGLGDIQRDDLEAKREQDGTKDSTDGQHRVTGKHGTGRVDQYRTEVWHRVCPPKVNRSCAVLVPGRRFIIFRENSKLDMDGNGGAL